MTAPASAAEAIPRPHGGRRHPCRPRRGRRGPARARARGPVRGVARNRPAGPARAVGRGPHRAAGPRHRGVAAQARPAAVAALLHGGRRGARPGTGPSARHLGGHRRDPGNGGGAGDFAGRHRHALERVLLADGQRIGLESTLPAPGAGSATSPKRSTRPRRCMRRSAPRAWSSAPPSSESRRPCRRRARPRCWSRRRPCRCCCSTAARSTSTGRPIEVVRALYRGDRIAFETQLT